MVCGTRTFVAYVLISVLLGECWGFYVEGVGRRDRFRSYLGEIVSFLVASHTTVAFGP